MDIPQLVRVNPNDVPDLHKISTETFYESFAAMNRESDIQKYMDTHLSEAKLLSEINHPHSEFYFVRLHDELVGYLKINYKDAQTELKDQNGLEIERIYIRKEFHGHRLGKFLFDKALQRARGLRTDFLWLGVWEKNNKAIAFYARMGMEAFGTHPFQLGDDGQTDILMRIFLTI